MIFSFFSLDVISDKKYIFLKLIIVFPDNVKHQCQEVIPELDYKYFSNNLFFLCLKLKKIFNLLGGQCNTSNTGYFSLLKNLSTLYRPGVVYKFMLYKVYNLLISYKYFSSVECTTHTAQRSSAICRSCRSNSTVWDTTFRLKGL